ncbi:hypothetical protein NQ318_016187 [Aromia moschata]|uniref:DDE-1 domain-containing protein n=1 Tax=Aromia moschata TaxID=1265417 RepID=A0AAV8YD39_9CUCU|nr:hypothetical protein NQ318_016187 [Aromia moschata]
MAENIKLLAKLYYGLSPLQIRGAAYEFAEANNIKHSFNKTRKLAGKDWLYGFLKRNTSVSIRKPEATSLNRVTAFNKDEVQMFYSNLETLMEKYNFTSSKIFNMDETGISTVQDPGTIVAEKGQRRVGSVTSYERGKNITVICAVSSSGTYIPPMFIYPRKRMSPQLCNGGPTEAIYHCSKNGWTNPDLFGVWLKHFTKFAKPSATEPVLLITDNHYSHISLEAYTYCRDNHIVMLSIPPHTSHRIQPLDIAFYGPLKTAFRKECDLFMKSKALQKITPYDVASIFNKAYCNVATIQKGVAGFQAAGIFPINPNVFGEEDFLASDYLTGSEHQNIPLIIDDSAVGVTNHDQNQSTYIQHKQNLLETNAPVAAITLPEINASPGPSSILQLSKTILSPLPSLPAPTSKKNTGTKQHSAILTASPMKATLEEKSKKREKKLKKVKQETSRKNKKIVTKIQKTRSKKNHRKPVSSDDTDTSSDEKFLAAKKKKMYSKSTIVWSDSSDEENLQNLFDDSDDDNPTAKEEKCCVCKEFGKNEMWFRCRGCGQWAHKDCSGADSADEYMCDYCQKRRKTARRLNL